MTEDQLYEEQRKLVLARLRTLNPDAKIMSGKDKELSVRDLIKHVEKNDPTGKDVVKAQMKMLKILAEV